MEISKSQRSRWAERGLPIADRPCEWESGKARWKGHFDLEPLEPDTAFYDGLQMPARTAFRFRGESGRPNVEAIVRVSNGFAEMESLTILNAAAGGIRTLDLRNVVVDTVVAQVADLTAFQVTKLPGGWFEISDAPNAGSVVTTQRVRGRGHPRTPEDRIRRAGEIYEGAAGHEPRKRVADELGVSRRTASRYIEAWRATTRKGEA